MSQWADLVERARSGDREAQGELLHPFLAPLRAYIRGRIGTRIATHESVSDLVQTVCREVLQDLTAVTLSDARALRGWMFATAERKLADRARRLNADKRGTGRTRVGLRAIDTDAGTERGRSAATPDPVEALIARETVERIAAALDAMAEADRSLIEWIKFRQLSIAEVARRLGQTEGAVRVRLFRALGRLAKRLEPM